MTRMSPKEFAKLLERDGHHCIHCGTTEGLVPHHRNNRRMGGSRRLETPANVIVICSSLNGLMESDPATADWAIQRGWKLRSFQNPKDFPVKDATTGSYWWLDDNYERTAVTP